LERVVAADAECIDGKIEKSEAKYRMLGRDGDWRWMRSVLRATERDSTGKAVRLLGTMTDITLLENAVDLAQAKEAELASLIVNAPVAMAVLALSGKFLLLNAACYRLLGYPEGTLRDRSLWRLANIEMMAELRTEVEGLIDGKVSTFTAEKQYERPDGSKVDFVVRMSKIRGNTSEQTRIVAQMIDITEKNRLAKLKDDFLATTSHELRTPLTVVHGALSLLQGLGELPGQSEKLLGLARRNSDRLLHLVNDLLDFQKLNSGQLSLQLEVVNVVDLVKQSVEEIEPLVSKFGVNITFDAVRKHLWVRADPLRAKQVITNLLSNAAKFAPPDGSIEVGLDETCTVSVTDHGRGISDEFRDRIFLPFSQQAEHSTRAREGSGLGLAISNGLVERMGGQIGFESAPNVRTTFWVRFPMAAEDERRSA
jgi:PAS domain S-box-containing protein